EQNMDFKDAKDMSKAWEKHVILKPWDITSKILGGGMFAANSKATLNDKIELYFNDHEFSFLMLQENYLNTQPMRASAFDGHEVRQLYVPMFWNQMPKRMAKEGKDIVPQVIDLMDSYYLTRDDFDAICELGVGSMAEVKIEAATKSTFTRLYVPVHNLLLLTA